MCFYRLWLEEQQLKLFIKNFFPISSLKYGQKKLKGFAELVNSHLGSQKAIAPFTNTLKSILSDKCFIY